MKANHEWEVKRKVIKDMLERGKKVAMIVKDGVASRATVNRVKKALEMGDDIKTKERSGRPRSSRTPANIRKANRLIQKSQRTNIADVSRKLRPPLLLRVQNYQG